MAAAYASLLSLGHILHPLLQHPPRQMADLDKAQIDSLLQIITFLQDFLEDFSLTRGEEIRPLEEKIATSAYAAEDIIESCVLDQILSISQGIFSHFNFCFQENDHLRCISRHLQKVIEEFGSMKKDVLKIKETEGVKIVQQPKEYATAAASFVRGASSGKNTMVGFDEDLIQIMETLTGHQPSLRIVSIVGMGGIGKATLARNVYHHPFIVERFHIHAWVTISQQYCVREILSSLLRDVRVPAECGKEINQLTDEEIGEYLYKSLSGRKYLIVMDDMWSIDCWNDIKRFFPDNNNCSRVMITTRLTNVADDFCSCAPHQLHFLDSDQSWALFCDKVFGKESCPPELEEAGKTIVRNCGALPVAIVVISGLLAKSSRTVEYWEYVANDSYAASNMGGDGFCFDILSLSYKHLPVHLKPCFLHMATFPVDHKIKISKLVKLWVAEGIVKPIRDRSLEETAEDNLKDLIDRNLIQVHDYGSRNNMKTCTMHDLLRDLCLREARKEKFPRVTKKHSRVIDIVHGSPDGEGLVYMFKKMYRLLEAQNFSSRDKIVQLVSSRYIDFNNLFLKNLLSPLESLPLLWNVQSITMRDYTMEQSMNLPDEIWEMPQLRHLKWKTGVFHLPDPPSGNGSRDIIVLKNLQTLYKMRNFRCTDEVLQRIPNLKKLGITYEGNYFQWHYYEVYNLARLLNLESLFLDGGCVLGLENLCLPRSIKKLTLMRCRLFWEDLTVIGSLPHLQVVNLMNEAVVGCIWNPVEGQFLELKSLRIEFANLVEWTADSSHFPRLEKLHLGFLGRLKEIPYGIGEIPTLRSISLKFCSSSANSSVKKIEEEQRNLGNFQLLVRIT